MPVDSQHETPDPLKAAIVIPHYNDELRLARLLNSLTAQSRNQLRLEWKIIVVDDLSPSPDAAEKITRESGAFFLSGTGRGSYSARNIGINFAGNVAAVLFTDSDCIFSDRALKHYEDWIVGEDTRPLAAGPIRLFSSISNRPNRWESLDIATGLPQERKVKNEQVAVTANLCVRTKCFERYGVFNETHRSGGDIEFTRRVASETGGIAWIPGAEIFHPARATRNEHVNKMRRVQGGALDRDRNSNGNLPLGRFIQHFSRAARPPIDAWYRILSSKELGAIHKWQACGAALEQKIARTAFVLTHRKQPRDSDSHSSHGAASVPATPR